MRGSRIGFPLGATGWTRKDHLPTWAANGRWEKGDTLLVRKHSFGSGAGKEAEFTICVAETEAGLATR